MTSSSQEEIRNTAQAVTDLHIATVPGEHARPAGHAAANLCSEAGPALLAAPTQLQNLIAEAIEIGYAAALRDVRDGDFDGDLQEWRPGLFQE
ncbi:hypothetical protein [Streptomyces sp. Ru87]|uniref:hypothetical protein n=1 Tax=Streptomyces sp. Ru87 TaxID=2044307 RepID=UPI000BF6C1D8|nr:hypothetical protein [Streptomyces sp. Ru87]PGH48130.1 hypothetical protein CRI70_24850 [Streptomyces sp. Ru87]